MKNFKELYLFPLALIFLEIAIFLSNDMYLPSMPTIARDLGLSQTQIQYTLTLWFLGSSSLQLILGPISDRFGRKSVVVIGGVVYVISSYVCAIAYDINLLFWARFIQGSTICAVLVAGSAAVHESFNTRMAIKIFAFINAVTILAPAFGPLFGALIVQVASWRYIFYFLSFLGLLATTSVVLFMPESNHHKHKMHWRTIFNDYARLLTNSEYMLPNISYCLLLGIFFLWMFEAPFLMIQSYGVSNLYYGIAQTCIFSCFFVGAELTKWILNRHNLRRLINISIIITVTGTLLFTFTAKIWDDMLLGIFCLMLISTGASMLFAPLNRIAIEASTVPMGRRMAISSTMISLFGALSGWIISIIQVHTLLNVATLIIICVAVTIVLLVNTKTPILIPEG